MLPDELHHDGVLALDREQPRPYIATALLCLHAGGPAFRERGTPYGIGGAIGPGEGVCGAPGTGWVGPGIA